MQKLYSQLGGAKVICAVALAETQLAAMQDALPAERASLRHPLQIGFGGSESASSFTEGSVVELRAKMRWAGVAKGLGAKNENLRDAHSWTRRSLVKGLGGGNKSLRRLRSYLRTLLVWKDLGHRAVKRNRTEVWKWECYGICLLSRSHGSYANAGAYTLLRLRDRTPHEGAGESCRAAETWRRDEVVLARREWSGAVLYCRLVHCNEKAVGGQSASDRVPPSLSLIALVHRRQHTRTHAHTPYPPNRRRCFSAVPLLPAVSERLVVSPRPQRCHDARLARAANARHEGFVGLLVKRQPLDDNADKDKPATRLASFLCCVVAVCPRNADLHPLPRRSVKSSTSSAA